MKSVNEILEIKEPLAWHKFKGFQRPPIIFRLINNEQ
jgi:hypothetical protein